MWKAEQTESVNVVVCRDNIFCKSKMLTSLYLITCLRIFFFAGSQLCSPWTRSSYTYYVDSSRVSQSVAVSTCRTQYGAELASISCLSEALYVNNIS